MSVRTLGYINSGSAVVYVSECIVYRIKNAGITYYMKANEIEV